MDIFSTAFQSGLVRFITSGAVVNFFTVIIGSLIGLLLKKGIPERVKTTLMNGMALCVIYIGVTGLLEENINVLVVIASFAVGAVLGELADFDGMVNKLGTALESKCGNGDVRIADGFVTATLLFCVGAMTVVGSIDSGISGDNVTLYSKSIIDGVSAIALTSSLGIGVMLASLSVLIIEGSITLLATVVSPILSDISVSHMSLIGSLLIISLGFNMLGITKIKVMNYLPAVFLPIIIFMFI